MRFTLPYEDLSIKCGTTIMVHEPDGKEHYVTNVEYDHRYTKIVTVVETTPFDEGDVKHRDEIMEPDDAPEGYSMVSWGEP